MGIGTTVGLIGARRTKTEKEITEVKNAIRDDLDELNETLGDIEALVSQGGTIRTEYVNFTNGSTTYDTSWVLGISDNENVNINGTVPSNKFVTLQDVELPAGSYEIQSASRSDSSKWFFQIVYLNNGTAGTQIWDSTSNPKQLTLEEATTVRIRLRILSGTFSNSSNTLHVEKITVIPPSRYEDIAEMLTDHEVKNEQIESFIYKKNIYSKLTNGTNHYQSNAFDVVISNEEDIEVDGEPTANLNVTLKTLTLKSGKYDFEYKLNGGSAVSGDYYMIQFIKTGESDPFISVETSSMSANANVRTFTIDEESEVTIRLRVLNGNSYTNLSTKISLYNHKENDMFDSVTDFINHMTEVYMRVGGQTILETSDVPICTLIDDDTTTVSDVERYIDACDDCEVKGTLATLTSKWENNQTLLDTLLEAEQAGHRVIIHAYSQTLNDEWHDKDVELCRANLVKGIQMMRRAGLGNPNFWVTPNNVADLSFSEMAKQLGLTARFIGNDTYNGKNHHNRYYINRVGLDKTAESLTAAKAKADECFANKGWLVVMTHFYNWDAEDVPIFTEFVEYCKTLGFSMEAVEEAWYHKKHVYELHELFNQG